MEALQSWLAQRADQQPGPANWLALTAAVDAFGGIEALQLQQLTLLIHALAASGSGGLNPPGAAAARDGFPLVAPDRPVAAANAAAAAEGALELHAAASASLAAGRAAYVRTVCDRLAACLERDGSAEMAPVNGNPASPHAAAAIDATSSDEQVHRQQEQGKRLLQHQKVATEAAGNQDLSGSETETEGQQQVAAAVARSETVDRYSLDVDQTAALLWSLALLRAKPRQQLLQALLTPLRDALRSAAAPALASLICDAAVLGAQLRASWLAGFKSAAVACSERADGGSIAGILWGLARWADVAGSTVVCAVLGVQWLDALSCLLCMVLG